MSGQPYPEGVERAVKLLDQIEALNSEAKDLAALVVRLAAVKEERSARAAELGKLLESMDLTFEGNYGYPARMAWFLAEMRRQIVKKT